jgi:hypothetical protein
MHTPAMALPGASLLLHDPAGAQIAAQVFAPRTPRAGIGPLLVLGGDVSVATPGQGVDVATGARAGTVTLSAGSAVVSAAAVTAVSRIFLTGQNASGTSGNLTVSARTPGSGFTITSSSGTDTRLVAWEIREPA